MLMRNVMEYNGKTLFSTQELNELHNKMLKFATIQLKDEHLAEDAVQEAFYIAFNKVEQFEQRASFKTWLFTILKNKVIDILREQQRYLLHSDQQANEDVIENRFFDQTEHWDIRFTPKPIIKAHLLIHQQEFWTILQCCLERLPQQQARVFMMREFMEFSSDEICFHEEISTSNLNVLLYRARLKLQDCLVKKGVENH
ncbi:sigma-70 family RNA polymerase sigma factor [Gallibacterium trehalosifermentans]|uniref:Sigma-70 family RNA polymerase sigma factor n=1 Tax=Gallibacterium trehalosifermentans TaxID=516935 RepID=A0ABV6H058_9PAST